MMKVVIKENDSENGISVEIRCRQVDRRVEKLKAYVERFDDSVRGKSDGAYTNIRTGEILYIESVDNKVFLYTENKVYETEKKLYELEGILDSKDFFRCGKSLILNINKIKSLRPEITRNILATMTNGEVVVISRRYVGAFKELLMGGRAADAK